MANDALDLEVAVMEEDDNEEDDTAASMSCGVSRCPQASTVWPSQVRLEQHRFGFVQI